MEKYAIKKGSSSVQRDEKRLTTAPIRERPKYSDMHYKTNNIQLPIIRGKNTGGRESNIVSRDFKRSQVMKKQQMGKIEVQHEEIHKRPQTSKGSRNTAKKQSQYYEQGQDDLIITSMHDKIDMFKKPAKEHILSVKHT